jgi:hypothetical protein
MRSQALFCSTSVLLAALALGAHAPARAQTTEVLRTFEPGTGQAFTVGHAVVDLPAGLAYVMTEKPPRGRRGGPTEMQIVARRLANGARRWTSRSAAVPLTVEGGRLIALRAARTLADVVMLDPRNGRPRGVCTGARLSVGEDLGHASTVAAARRAGVTYLVATDRSWYAGGAAPPPGLNLNSSSTRYFRLSVAGSQCALTQVPDDPFPAASAGSVQLTRTREVADWVFALTLASGARVVLGRSTEPYGVDVAADDRYVVLRERRVTRPYAITLHTTFFDARTGARVFEGDAEGAGFTFTGHVILALHGQSLIVSDARTGRALWNQVTADLGYHGPYPP